MGWKWLVWLGVLLLWAAPVGAQPEPRPDRPAILLPPVGVTPVDDPTPAPPPERAPNPDPLGPLGRGATGLPPALRTTVEALGASSGVPDGAGLSWYPTVPVRNQNARMGLANFQAGATVPVSTSDRGGWYANAAARYLSVQTNAILPTDQVQFPGQFWDVQAGGAYLHQLDGGWSWGVTLNIGSASDHPFNSIHEATLSALAFVRKPSGERNGWLFFVVSTTNGQIGHNIPIPGVAYEYNTDRLRAVIGLPFLTVDYRATDAVQLELIYAAITDVLARASYHVTDHARFFAGFEWANQAWLRADRQRSTDQTFLYEMRLEGGFGYKIAGRIDLRVSAGYAFDRFFVENTGLEFGGRNRVNLAPGPYLAAQLEFKF